MKPLNSRYLQVLKNLCVIERCPLLGGNLKKIVTFATKCFICYSWHVRYLGCLLLGGFTVMTKIWEQEKYCTILITGLWLVRKVFYYEYVKQETCIYFISRKSVSTSCQTNLSFCCLHFFQMQDFLTFYSLNV